MIDSAAMSTDAGIAGGNGVSAAVAGVATTALEREALAVARGICRLFARNDIWCLAEMPLRNGRRADLMGIDTRGHVVIVEIKVARADLLGDAKWTEYLDHCDRFYWGLAPHLDRTILETPAFLPERCGVIVGDGYDAEILRPAASQPLAAARRKAEIERLARAALRRQTAALDPQGGWWRDGGA
ncbi:MmcB family DNA repair protein [Novosphingobium sp.]|uniref:MmcB family DNA repair protein n=1 Tax=Novosphingobium sp. TaxID=1874826 RepID=UPI0038B912B9